MAHFTKLYFLFVVDMNMIIDRVFQKSLEVATKVD